MVEGEAINADVPPSCCELVTPHKVPTSMSGFKDLKRCLKGMDGYNKEVSCLVNFL